MFVRRGIGLGLGLRFCFSNETKLAFCKMNDEEKKPTCLRLWTSEPSILYKKLAGSEANSLGLKRTRSYSACKQTLMVKN